MGDERVIKANNIGDLLSDVERLRKTLQKQSTIQIRGKTERELIRSVALGWFEKYEGTLSDGTEAWETLSQVSENFKDLDALSQSATTKARYLELLRIIQARLIQLRSEALSGAKKTVVRPGVVDLGALVPNADMQKIIYLRWEETERCLDVAPLACVVMMGALLEALLLARVNKLDDKAAIFKLKSTPLDKSGKPISLSDWTLQNYIGVAHEMGWIRKSAKDVSVTMMEYRNLIHPEKQLRLKIILEPQDSKMFWAVFKELSKQLVDSV